MNSRSKYLLKNTSIFAIGSLGTKIINFFLVPLYTYILTTEEYGTADLLFTIATVIVPLIMFNLGEAIMRFALDADADYSKIFTISLATIVFGMFISLLIIPVASKFDIIAEYKVYLYLYVVLYAMKEVVLGFLRGREQLKTYVACNILYSLIVAILNILFLVFLKLGVEGYLMAYIFSEAIAIAFAVVAGKIYYYFSKLSFDKILAKKMIKFSLAVIPNTMLWWVINSSDRVMVIALKSVSENGLLAIGYKLPSILTMFNTVLMQAWKYSAIREKESPDRNEFANVMLERFFKTSALISATMILMIKPFTKILFADAYFSAWKSSCILLVGFVFMGLGTFVGTLYYVEKNMIGNMMSAILGAIANIVMNALLIPGFGAAGATLAASISYCIIMLYRYFDTKKYQRLEIFRGDYMVIILLLIVLCGSQFISWSGVSLVISILSYAVILLMNYRLIKGLIQRSFCLVKNIGDKKSDK